ncbi:MAG: efflux RND transporter periplasmic adaptor subunit [Ardenticatenaceae bacterium]|nr:efflux RND transporter periplasmic adaptor subunit [Anaerolineales bacterium]MCB8921439.1 efflux RND transporter periplasmic adaptor subunit [Ardenticatenaceae bacterium]MCB8991556.1 efflux RND transporter periplasmic adaptor subunit [Ardenticatenaceae bacterium]
MFRKKGFWTILIIFLLAIGGGSYYYYNNVYLPSQETDEPTIQTAKVRTGDIVVSASGAGVVVSASEIDLGFRAAGTLADVTVQIGDKVQAGDVLAVLDDTDARKAVALAEIQLAQAALQVNPDALTENISLSEISISQAEINLASAQANLDELLSWEPDGDAIALAEANLAAAQAGYDAAVNKDAVAGSSVTAARVNLEQAQTALVDAQAAYDVAFDPGRDWELNDPRRATALENERDSAIRNLEKAQGALEIAQANYSLAVGNLNNDNATGAEVSVINAEQALVKAQTGPTDAEIEAAQLQVQQAQIGVVQAELSLEQAQINLEASQTALGQTVLVSPIDGVVVAVNAQVGESVGTTPFITVADLTQPLLEVYMDETDLDKVGLDYEVEVVFDALPDDIFVGRVVQIDPKLAIVDGVTAVRALVLLDTESFNKPQTLPVGMNAAVEIIGGRAEGALLVPVEALRELAPGQYAVFVMENDEPVLRVVEVGLMDFTSAEIISGLTQGEIVSTGVVDTE